jgi:hypothetical protein
VIREDKLIERAQEGDQEAFCLLARSYQRRIYALALQYTVDVRRSGHTPDRRGDTRLLHPGAAGNESRPGAGVQVARVSAIRKALGDSPQNREDYSALSFQPVA